MFCVNRKPVRWAGVLGLLLAALAAPRCAWGQAQLAAPVAGASGPPVHLTLEEAKHRALNNKLLNLAALNAESKAYAVKAARADYFPKITASALYFHFQDDLGTVLTVPSHSLTGPKGRALVTFPSASVAAAVLNQDTSFVQIGVVQPLTDILKVRQGVKIAQADQQIAKAQLEKAIRQVVGGVEQLYWGMLTARKLQAGAAASVREAELAAQSKAVDARLALVEARQALQEVSKQVDDLQDQLVGLLDLPPCTVLDLAEPPLPDLTFRCADEVVALALAASPERKEAGQNVLKADAALQAGKLDFMPSIGLTAGYINQTGASYIEPNIGYIGAAGTWTLFNGGKRIEVLQERKTIVAMANLKLSQTEDEVRQNAIKAYREVGDAQDTLKLATEMVVLRREAEKAAKGADLPAAVKARMNAEVEAVKAEMNLRIAGAKLLNLVGRD
jgi:outer membrane protein TolC